MLAAQRSEAVYSAERVQHSGLVDLVVLAAGRQGRSRFVWVLTVVFLG